MTAEVIKITGNLSTPDFRKYIHEFEEALRLKKSVRVDLRNAKYVSLYGVMLIEVYQDIFHSEKLKLEVIYRETGLYHSFVDLVKKKQEKEFEKFFREDYLKISKCESSLETWKAADLISSILKNKMNCTREISLAASWLIGEIADNAGVHGYKCLKSEKFPNPVYIVACENNNNVDICVVDRGVGIVNTLRSHGKKKLNGIKEKQFLAKALEKGISGHPVWSPGFGLYGTSEIIKRCNGCLDIFSNKYSIKLKDNKISPDMLLSDFNGTFIALRLSKDSVVELNDIITASTQEQLEEWQDDVALWT